jgi:hypothetical protein
MYNATNNSWTRFPMGLGQAREDMAAASLPSGLVFFAGGWSEGVRKCFFMLVVIENALSCWPALFLCTHRPCHSVHWSGLLL